MKNRFLSVCLTLLFTAQLLGAEPRATSSGSRITAVAEKDQRQAPIDRELQKALDVLGGDRGDAKSKSTWSLADIQDMGLRENPTLIAAAARIE